jgi:hypothetical protein
MKDYPELFDFEEACPNFWPSPNRRAEKGLVIVRGRHVSLTLYLLR